MAVQNPQQPEKVPFMQTQFAKILLLVMAVTLVGSLAFIVVSNIDNSQKMEEAMDDNEDMETEIMDLEDKLKSLETDINDKDLDIEEKDKMLEEKKQELEETRKKLNRLYASNKLTKNQLEEYKAKVEQLQYYIKKYQKEIEALKKENAELKGLVYQKDSEIDSVSSINDELYQQNTLNKTKLKAASYLKAAEFSFASINRRNKEKWGTLFKSRKKIEKIKTCFKIIENNLAEKGSRNIYLIYYNPNGSVNKNMSGGSGTFQLNGKSVVYSAKASINFTGAAKKVCITYPKPSNESFQSGKQTVKIYADGFMIGGASFSIK